MKPDLGLMQIDAFVDGELELTAQLEVERAMAEDADVRARAAAIRDLRQQIRRDADYFAAPAALRERIEAMTEPASTQPSRSTERPVGRPVGGRLQALWGWRPLSAALAATLALTLGAQIYFDRGQRETRLADEIVGSHVRSTLGQHLIDVSSSDHHLVKPFLSSRLDFSPPVRDTELGSALFLGGRIDYLDGRPVAALVYRQGEHLVNTFIWPSPTGDRQATFSTDRGFQIAHWSRDGMNYWTISDVNPAEFKSLVHLLAS